MESYIPTVVKMENGDVLVTRPDESGALVTFVIRNKKIIAKHDGRSSPPPSAPPAEPEQVVAYEAAYAARDLAARKIALLAKLVRHRQATYSASSV